MFEFFILSLFHSLEVGGAFILTTLLLNIKFDIKRIILISLGNGFFLEMLRLIKIPLGLHSILFLLIITLEIYFLYKFKTISIFNIFLNSIKSFFIILICELIFAAIYINIYSLNLNEIGNNNYLNIIYGLPQIILLYIIIVIFYNKRGKAYV